MTAAYLENPALDDRPIDPLPDPRRGTWVALRVLALLAILGGYAYLQYEIFSPAYGEPDCDGYVVLAKRIMHGGPIGVVDSNPFVHQTHVWVENDRGEVLPKFAPGYSLLLGVAYKISGGRDEAMFVVSPVMGGLTLIGAYLLFRLWLPAGSALLGTLALAVNTAFEFYSTYLLTHISEVCFVTWGIYFLTRWMRGNARTRVSDVSIAIAAGLTLGYACAIRHSSALLALVVIVAALTRLAREIKARSVRVAPLVALLIAYAIVPALMMGYDWRFFGSPFRTGYDLSNEQFSFTWPNFTDHAAILIRGLNYEMLFLMFPMGLIGMLFFGSWPERIIKVLWFVPLFIVYAAYYWMVPNTAYYRFMFPVVPLFVGCAFILMERIAAPRSTRCAIMLAVIGVLLWNGWPQYTKWLGLEKPDPAHSWRQPQKVAANHPNIISRIDLARGFVEAVSDDNALVFLQDGAHDSLGVRRNFTSYSVGAFTPERVGAFNHEPDERNGDPRQQISRRSRLADFYKSETRDSLREQQMQIIRRAIDDGREVVFFVALGQLPPMPALDFTLVKQFQPRGTDGRPTGPWCVYQAKLKPPPPPQPVTRPATNPS